MKAYSILVALALVPLSSAAAVTVDCTPGTLRSRLSETGMPDDGVIVVTGSVDVRDLVVLSSLNLQTLDLSGCSIAAITSSTPLLLGRHVFEADCLPDYVFAGASINELVLPSSLRKIGDGACMNTPLTAVTIPEGVVTIGDYALRDCGGLTSITLPSTVKSVGKECFAGCASLESLTLDTTSITAIPERLLAGCTSLASVKWPESVNEIAPLAFDGSQILSVRTYADTRLHPFALAHADALNYAHIPSDDASRATGVLMNDANLEGMDYHWSDIPEAAFAGVTGVYASQYMENAESVGSYAFYNTALDYLSLPEGLTSLGDAVFGNASGIARISVVNLKDNIPAVTGNTFAGLDRGEIMLVVDNRYIDQWKNAPEWGEFRVVPQSEGVHDVATDVFSIRYADGMVHLAADREITSVTVADEAGRTLATATPGVAQVSLPVASAGGRIVIVHTSFPDSSRTDKILLP